MPSHHETFWNHASFAVVGNAAQQNFPLLTYRGLKQRGKTVFAVDPTTATIDGDPVYRNLAGLPTQVDAVVLEVPRADTRDWIERVADAGIRDVWIHMGRDTPEALALAGERGLDVRAGNCAVMYLGPGFPIHAIHRWAVKLAGHY